jgi:hypothetical protein
MNFVKRRGSCTAKIHIIDEKLDELKSDFLNKIDKAVSELSLRLRVFISFLYESRNKLTVDSFKPENSVVNLRIADVGPFSAAYFPISYLYIQYWCTYIYSKYRRKY